MSAPPELRTTASVPPTRAPRRRRRTSRAERMVRLLAPFAVLAALAALSMGTVKVVEIVGPKPPRRAPYSAPSASTRADVASVLEGGAVPRFEIPGERLSLGATDDALAPVLPELGADF